MEERIAHGIERAYHGLHRGVCRGYEAVLQLISPPFCAACREFLSERSVFCVPCMRKLLPVVSVALPVTRDRSMKVFAAAIYQEPIKSLIVAKSWSDVAASSQLGELLWQRTCVKDLPCDYLIPIPLHWTRFAHRGFNQAHEIAGVIARKKDARVAPLLKRTKRTHFQSELSFSERSGNVHDAFALANIDVAQYRGKHLILVDDLMTTGVTLRSAALLLYKLKPASLTAVVAARVV